MANLIKIKRSTGTSTPGSLNDGELAFSYLSGKLFIGNTTAVIPIGGTHNPGILTANQALVTNSTSWVNAAQVANLQVEKVYANGSHGTAGYVLASGGTGTNAYWVDQGSLTVTPAGANQQIQFNGSGALAADADLTFDTATNKLTVGNSTVNTAITGSAIDTDGTLAVLGATTLSNTLTVTGFVNATVSVNSAILTTGSVSANASGIFPNSNTVGTQLGDADQRWSLTANTISASGLITGTDGLTITGTANASVAINVGANVNLTTTSINVGNSTVNTFANSSTLRASNALLTAIYANGSLGTSGDVLTSNGTAIYWGAATTTLNNLTDVTISAVANNNLLVYDADAAQWENHTIQGTSNEVEVTFASQNITVGLPDNVDITTSLDVGANVNLTTSSITVGNSTVNAALTATAFDIDGTIAGGNTTLVGFINVSSTANVGGAVTLRSTVTVNGALTVANTAALGNTTITGFANVSGSLEVDGSITLGDAATDTLTINAEVNSNIVPAANVTYDLGAAGDRWNYVYSNNVTATTINATDAVFTGNLTVSGTLTTVDTLNLTVKDPLIRLANNNTTDSVDIGFFGEYLDTTQKYTAFFRDQTDGKFKIYTGLTNIPGTTVDLTGGTLPGFVIGAIEANSLTLTTALAVASGGTGAATFTAKGVIYGNGTGALQVTAAGTDGKVLQANSTGFPVFDDLDGGTF